MDAELKTKWVNALRSGEYKQCRNTLHEGEAYCCLGVLAVISGLDVEGRVGLLADPDSYEPIYNLIGSKFIARNLAERNDGHYYHPHSFSEIADYIEKNL
jgi:hypothetical protein